MTVVSDIYVLRVRVPCDLLVRTLKAPATSSSSPTELKYLGSDWMPLMASVSSYHP